MSYYAFLRNSTYRRYGIFVITLFLGLYTIQAWVNYKNIEDSIKQTKQDILKLQEEIDYMDKWYKNYLLSDYAPYFLGHENGQLYGGERLVVVEYRKPPVEQIAPAPQADDGQIVIETPEESRQLFIHQRIKPLAELGLFD